MPIQKERIHYLLSVFSVNQASAEEENELKNLLFEAEGNPALKDYMHEIWSGFDPVKDSSGLDWNMVYDRVMALQKVQMNSKVRSIRWSRFAAAALIFGVLASGYYLFFQYRAKEPADSVAKLSIQTDIAPPSGNKATLTLADGREIDLDSRGNGIIALQDDIAINKGANGEISYVGDATREVSFNTLSVPRGSIPLSLTLADGSQIWLNVGSSLTYPTAFTGRERRVKIAGEAYFEVAPNASVPFIVEHENVSIRVLGTHFNVNAYEDEAEEQITLLEGAVQVDKNSLSQKLNPGQQARVNKKENNGIRILNDVEIHEVMAWKDGKFRFGESVDIGAIMRQISRWYDVEIEFEGNISQRFWGSISKDVKVSQVLKILEATGAVKFKVEGEKKKIIVMPGSS